MVVNLCLPHFYTTAHCNKLCADGYDVTNLVSADPALRRRGFKLEYFLRPPVQVTLKFGFQVELCRVDVELWPLGMDRGQACRRLEISTNCDSLSSTGTKDFQQKEQIQMKLKGQNAPNREDLQNHESKSWQSNGHQWSVQAQQWGEEAQSEPQQRGHVFKHQSNPESSCSEPEFKLVARCELKEETKVCFTHLNFCPRAPFLSPPPPQPANCQQEELWSRGLLSLGGVTQLRVTVPCGGAASSLGLKSLAVWGQPARSCTAEEVERIKKVHEASKRQLQQPAFFAPAIRQSKQPLEESPRHSIPEEFLDPITQEVMTLPMLLPSGVSVDNSTLEEYQKREATWGRSPNDPFTGVPFTSTFCPLPNPQLKSRIDHFLLQKGMMRRDGMLGRGESGENPQASRLLVSEVHEQSQSSLCLTKCSNSAAAEYNADTSNTNRIVKTDAESEASSDNKNHTSNAEPLSTNSKSTLNRRKKQDLSEIYKESTDTLTAERHLRSKKQKSDADSVPSCSSHEQRLSASLDEALFSALQGRPSFTSNLHQQKRVSPDSERLNTTQQNSGVPSSSTGEKMCSACSCSVSVYSSASSIYRLSCGHLLCRACLQKESSSLKSATSSTSNHIVCPTCRRPTPRALITRVHH